MDKNQETIKAYLADGKKLKQEGNINGAKEKYLLALELNPNNVSALLQLAVVYENQGELETAAKYSQRAIKIAPENGLAQGTLGSILIREGKIEEAIIALEKSEKLLPEKSPVWVYLRWGEALEKKGKIEEAIAVYEKAVEKKTEKKEECLQILWIKLGDAYQQQKRWDEAIMVYKKVEKINPDLGKKLTSELQYAKLKQQSKKQDDPAWYLNLGKLELEKGNLEEGIANYQKAIEINPEQPAWVYKNLGDAFFEQYKFDEAIITYQKVLERKEQRSVVFCTKLGNAYHKQGRWEEAIASYKKVLEIKPNYDSEKFYLELRSAQIKQGQNEEATRSYQKALARNCLINHADKIVYCPIAKNACTLFKRMMLDISGEQGKYEESNCNLHQYVSENFNILKDTGWGLSDFFGSGKQEYFKFIILRNPFSRIVSAYLNKVAKNPRNYEKFVLPVIKDVYKALGEEMDLKKSITFSQFVDYLNRTEDCYLDKHWRPQHICFGEGIIKFDYVGQFEKLDEVIEKIEKKIGRKLTQEVSKNRTKYGNYSKDEKFHDKYPHELRELDGLPRAENFYTPELEEIVRKRYAEDIKIYEREFNVKLGRIG
ncbi:MAG: tetratricopeptide repeat protein [Gomphosphaeria aponina SAG 52.96 = DSM 107014]|uniref:Tetratricopeptide repeat protein n=1 Tax=Gomphosphaeria aponina SAG 52.96 = DSM 107014 TaxID=1521640 RepID=A0A941GUB7_9CHRO|nr:tetratricopeptide repeat protein [Gomphosphaeria aponina SAG 52.96 = DSM 107014]